MKVEVKKLENSEVELNVEVLPDEMEQYLDLAAKKISGDMEIAGFRKGMAPRNVLEAKVGKGRIFEEGANIAFMKTYAKAVQDENLEAIGEPKVEINKLAPGNNFSYKATVAILPKMELPSFEGLKVKRKEVKVDDKELEQNLKQLQKSRAKIAAVSRAAKKGDQVEVDFKTFQDNVPVENGESKNHPLTIGEGYFIPGFEEELIGMKKADKKEFDLTFPEKYQEKKLAGKKVHFKVEMKEVREQELPKLDDEFAKGLGKFKDMTDLKKQLSENMKKEKEAKEEQKLELETVQKIGEKIEVTIPEVLIANEQQKMKSEMKMMVEQQGGQFEKYLESIKKTEEQFLDSFKDKAIERVKTALILREVAKKEKIVVSDEELKKEIDMQAEKYQQNPEIIGKLNEDNYKEYTRDLLSNKKVFEFLKKKMVQ